MAFSPQVYFQIQYRTVLHGVMHRPETTISISERTLSRSTASGERGRTSSPKNHGKALVANKSPSKGQIIHARASQEAGRIPKTVDDAKLRATDDGKSLPVARSLISDSDGRLGLSETRQRIELERDGFSTTAAHKRDPIILREISAQANSRNRNR